MTTGGVTSRGETSDATMREKTIAETMIAEATETTAIRGTVTGTTVEMRIEETQGGATDLTTGGMTGVSAGNVTMREVDAILEGVATQEGTRIQEIEVNVQLERILLIAEIWAEGTQERGEILETIGPPEETLEMTKDILEKGETLEDMVTEGMQETDRIRGQTTEGILTIETAGMVEIGIGETRGAKTEGATAEVGVIKELTAHREEVIKGVQGEAREGAQGGAPEEVEMAIES